MSSNTIYATSLALILVLQGIIVQYLEKVSTITIIQSFPLSLSGRLVIKSIDIYSKGFYATGKGCNKP